MKMVPNDRDVFEGLSKGPFAQDGFDGRLRNRIIERIKQEQERAKPRRSFWQWPAGAMAAIAIILTSVWWWQGQSKVDMNALTIPPVEASATILQPPTMNRSLTVTETKKYALLIGLRSDEQHAGIPVSEYRTVLVADEDEPERLGLIADLPGLYMPFGQNFWLIGNVELADSRRMLNATQATNLKAVQTQNAAQAPDFVLSEQVMYAGNEYLSIKATVKNEEGEQSEHWWVKHIDHINEYSQVEPYTVMSNLLVATLDQDEITSGQWRIYRNPGKWVSELYDPRTGKGQVIEQLPANVVQNDRLTLDWTDIDRIEPAARDAFTYGNVLGVVTDQAIVVHSLRNGTPVSRTVRIPLDANESVIMIQWAQNDKIDYVDKWIQEFRGLQDKSK